MFVVYLKLVILNKDFVCFIILTSYCMIFNKTFDLDINLKKKITR